MTGRRRRTRWFMNMGGALLLGPLAALAQPPMPGGTLRVGWGGDVPGLILAVGPPGGPVAPGRNRAVPAHSVGAQPPPRIREEPPLLQAGTPLSRSYRMAHHPGRGDARHCAAGGRSGFCQRGLARPRGTPG